MPKKTKKAHKSLIFPIKTKKALITLYQNLCSLMVPAVGLEPTCLAAMDFESIASTNFTTRAINKIYKYLLLKITKLENIYQY